MASFLKKRKKAEFGKQFESMLSAARLGESPLAQWIKTLKHLVQQLEPHAQPAVPASVARSMEDELEQAVLGTSGIEDTIKRTRTIFERLFRNDEETEGTDWLSDVEAYLKNHYVSYQSLGDLSDRFGLNASYLSYVFKSKKNKSPTDYVGSNCGSKRPRG